MKPNDPFYNLQWHLKAMGDLETVWNDYTGKGVKFAVYDGGVDTSHPDLIGNYDFASEPKFNGEVISGAGPNAHGTAIAGLMAATGNNGIGMTGVAWGASVTSVNLYDANSPFAFGGRAFFEGVRHMANFDVTNNSWGDFPHFGGDSVQMREALADVVSTGRGGLGTNVMHAAGNDNADMSGEWLATTRYTISVAAMGDEGFPSDYSSFGSGLLVTTPSSGYLKMLYATDVVGDEGHVPAGPDDGFDGTGNYTPYMGGTSGATPIAGAMIGLMLEANANLGWRDVQTILSLSADHTGSAIGATALGENENGFWHLTKEDNWNGGGRHFSIDYGYGRINAYSAVRMAEAYKYFASEAQTSKNEIAVQTETMNIDRTLTSKGSFDYAFDIAENVDLEHVDLAVKMQFSDFTNIRIYLTSPAGTKAIVYQGDDTRLAGDFANEHEHPFGIASLRGESSKGTWTLTVENVGDTPLEVGRIVSAGFTSYGSAPSTNDVYHYTDEFSDMVALSGEERRVALNDDDGGTDWLDASAVHAASTVDLQAGKAQIDGVDMTLSGIENAITGDGDDRLIGNDGSNQLVGMRGNDYLEGRAGGDVLKGGAGSDTAGYIDAESAVWADLADSSRNFGDARGDTYESIENLIGSAHFDVLKGNDVGNRIEGGDGNDILQGRGGDDVLIGGKGADLAVYVNDFSAYGLSMGADGRLTVEGEGRDTLEGVETLQFKDGVYDVASGKFTSKAAGLDAFLASTDVDEAFSAADREIILGVIIEAYQKSDTARAQFDSWISSGHTLRVNYGEGRFDAWDGVTTLDLKQLDRASYIDFNGNAVRDYPFTGIIHELGHALRLLPDNQNDDNPSGDNQNYANIIYQEAGYSKQLAYMAYDASGNVIERGRQYTDGMAIDNAWVKKWVWLPNNYDVTNGGTKSPSQKDLIIGSPDDNVLNSGAGDDFVYGLAGNDRLIGGAGDDRLAGGKGADVLDGGAGSDFASYVHADTGVVVSLLNPSANTGEAAGDRYVSIENIIGSSFADRLTGDAGANQIEGRAGDDRLNGGAGDDAISGGDGNDNIDGGTGKDTIDGGSGADVINGGADDDLMNGGEGKDYIYGGTGDDIANGGAGDDTMDGADGADSLSGDDGNDIISGGKGRDRLDGGAGNDILIGGNDDDELVGGTGLNHLYGGAGSDILVGGADVDKLFGGDGNDLLFGGLGRDFMTGGAGSDVFQFRTVQDSAVGGLRDRIFDFTKGEDRIDVSAIDSDVGLGIANGNNVFGFMGTGAFTQAGQIRYLIASNGTTIIQFNTDGDLTTAEFEIELDRNSVALTADDFVL